LNRRQGEEKGKGKSMRWGQENSLSLPGKEKTERKKKLAKPQQDQHWIHSLGSIKKEWIAEEEWEDQLRKRRNCCGKKEEASGASKGIRRGKKRFG